MTENSLERGRKLLELSKYMCDLTILQEKEKHFNEYPKGNVIVKCVKRQYRDKNNNINKYKNYYYYIDVDKKQYYVGKNKNRPESLNDIYDYACKGDETDNEINLCRYNSSNMVETFGVDNQATKNNKNYIEDYTKKENLLIICDMLLDKRQTQIQIEELRVKIKDLTTELNITKKKDDVDITDEYLQQLGKTQSENRQTAKEHRLNRIYKTYIARNGTKDQIQKEFRSIKQAEFYFAGGKIIENRLNEPMRSKIELLVGDILQSLNIEYKYEFYVKEATVSCDFLVYICDKEYYVEILGMMNNADYRQRWYDKERAYKNAGIETGKNLIVIDLSDPDNIDLEWISEIFIKIAMGEIPKGTMYGINKAIDACHRKSFFVSSCPA